MNTTTEKHYIPTHTTSPIMWFDAFQTVEHPLLQALVDSGAMVCIVMGEVTVYGIDSLMLLKVKPSSVYLECIATPDKQRGNGSGTRLLQALTTASDKSGVPVTLHATAVQNVSSRHPAISTGTNGKGKLPVTKLTTWYNRHGFHKTGPKSADGLPMQYTPQTPNLN